MSKFRTLALAGALTLAAVGSAHATTVTFFDGIAAGQASFAATVTGTGAAVETDTLVAPLSGASVDRGDYTITNNDGGTVSWTTYGTMSGAVTGINPARNGGGSDSGVRTAPADYYNSGITLTFDNPINAIAFEVGDWSTCCHAPVTELFISFDGGSAITVASADTYSDGQFPSQVTGSPTYEILVGAIDDTGTFSSVSFWGNGLGEYLVWGGEVSYSAVEAGSLPPSTVPLPAGGALLMAALAGLGLSRSRKRS